MNKTQRPAAKLTIHKTTGLEPYIYALHSLLSDNPSFRAQWICRANGLEVAHHAWLRQDQFGHLHVFCAWEDCAIASIDFEEIPFSNMPKPMPDVYRYTSPNALQL